MDSIDTRLNIAKFIAKELSQTISAEEQAELLEWVSLSELNAKEYKIIRNEIISEEWKNRYSTLNVDGEWTKFEKNNIVRSRLDIRFILKYAAVLLLPLSLILYLLMNDFLSDNYMDKLTESTNNRDISIGSSKAKLELANGEFVYLDGSSKDTIINVAYGKIVNKDNTLDYSQNGNINSNKLEYNKLTVPRGGEFSLLLKDGTKIWLNSESQLIYPPVFYGNKRQVFLKGEAYFQVAKNKFKPFIVNVNGVEVKVLGTSFNIEAYEEMNSVKTTLVEGSVSLKKGNEKIIIKPDQQAIVNKESDKIVVKNVEVYDYIAWREGMFYFNEASLEDILNKISRWYNAEIFYQNPQLKNLHFSIEVKRYESIESLLDIIESTGKVRFKIEKNIITVFE